MAANSGDCVLIEQQEGGILREKLAQVVSEFSKPLASSKSGVLCQVGKRVAVGGGGKGEW
jgi:hypothetical protein